MFNNLLTRILFFLILTVSISSCSNVTVESNESFLSVDLPDSTEVLLNKNSSIEYNKKFDSRTVKLTGEAFFNVTPGENPFVVVTEYGEIKVLGTEFNVKSDAEKLEVEVEKGHVEVNTKAGLKKLKRGDRAVYNKAENSIKSGKAEFKFRIWLSELRMELKKIGKEIKSNGKKAGKEFKKLGTEIGKEFK